MLLPLQFSWAAVAGYCTHEADAQTQHLGHHAHQPGTPDKADAEPAADADRAPGATDLDCSHGHGCCSALLGTALPAYASLVHVHPAAAAQVATALLALSPPERPQWWALA